ncbi:MAG: hypothetical protein SFW36_07650 [Leptolyngbyaceae cyanobacterium bins.59]|nr:hypothetical protein [Leptolyngbyaceae cyanobacterium bins.59]
MDQPFESDVMEDLATDNPVTAYEEFDEYSEIDEDGFNDGFVENLNGFAEDEAHFSADAFDEQAEGDLLEGDLWGDEGDFATEHRKNQRESNRTRHEQGQRRRGMDQGGEGGDQRRRPPRKRPPGHRGPWPPVQNSSGNQFYGDELDASSEDMEGLVDDFGGEGADEFTEDGQGADAFDAMEAAIADALEAEDSDEFLRQVVRGVRRAAQVARQVGRGVGQVARVVGPVASMIPLPQAQAIGAIANIAGQLLADGADEFEALDEMLAFAEAEDAVDAAAPIIAGLTIRTIMPRAARLNRTTRRQLVQSVRRSAQTLSRQQGARSIRAIPRVIQAVERTAQRRRIPARQLPQAVRQATASVARNPRLVSRLARATQHASSVTRRYSAGFSSEMPQRLVINGPVEILIRSR